MFNLYLFLQSSLCQSPHSPFVLLSIMHVHFTRIHIRRTLRVRLVKHADHADDDPFGRVHGLPPAVRVLVPRDVVAGVEDGDAHVPIAVDVRVEHLAQKGEGGRVLGVGPRELHDGLVDAVLVQCVLWADDQNVPGVDVDWRLDGEGVVLGGEDACDVLLEVDLRAFVCGFH